MNYFLGLDLGGTTVKGGLLDQDGHIIAKNEIPTGAGRPCGQVAADIAEQGKKLIDEAGVPADCVKAAGICSPGTINTEKGEVVFSGNLGWRCAPLSEELEKCLGIPVFLGNDANVAALGEARYGSGRNYRDSILITLGTGVGGGIIMGGRIFEGGRSAGAEIGHMAIVCGGEPCTCGRRGCFEAYASATALIRQAREAMNAPGGADSLMWKLCGGDPDAVCGKTVTDAVTAGDKTAEQVWDRYLDYLAEGTANLINIFRPEAVLYGGGVSKAGSLLLDRLVPKFEGLIFGGNDYAHVDFGIAALGNDAGICGAAAMAMDAYFMQ